MSERINVKAKKINTKVDDVIKFAKYFENDHRIIDSFQKLELPDYIDNHEKIEKITTYLESIKNKYMIENNFQSSQSLAFTRGIDLIWRFYKKEIKEIDSKESRDFLISGPISRIIK